MSGFTQGELAERIHKLQNMLCGKGIDLAILSQNTDIYYYTGSVQPLYLMVPASGEPVILARKAITRISEEVPQITLEAFSGTKDLVDIVGRHKLVGAKQIGFTLDTMPYASVARLLRIFPGTEIVDISWDLRMLRVSKSEAEIAIQKRAGEILARVPEEAIANFHPGMTELEMSAAIENYFRLNGHTSLVRSRREGVEMSGFGVLSAGINSLAGTKFEGICAGKGVSAAVPYGASFDPIAEDAPVVLDYAFNLDGYHVDQTRMFTWGQPSDKIMKAYDAMLRVQGSAVDALKPGVTWESVYRDAVSLAAEFGYAEVFMGIGTEQVRFIGHGVGLELDEPPFLAPKMSYPLEEGMVLAVEPKVALPGVGVVGIEDTYVIRRDGAERITTCPKDFIIVG